MATWKTVLYRTALFVEQYLHCTILYRAAFLIIQYCTARHCIVPYCSADGLQLTCQIRIVSVLYCTVLFHAVVQMEGWLGSAAHRLPPSVPVPEGRLERDHKVRAQGRGATHREPLPTPRVRPGEGWAAAAHHVGVPPGVQEQGCRRAGQ